MLRTSLPICILILFILTVPLGIKYLWSRSTVDINLKNLDSYEIGELVILDASASRADKLIWRILPKTDNFKIINKGKCALFSSSKPIDYTVIISASNGRDLDCRVFTLAYRKSKKQKTELTFFDQEVKSWLSPEMTKDSALKLAQSFKIVARTIENSTYDTIDNLILATAWANKEALGSDLETWKPFLSKFQEYLETNPPSTVEDHLPIWRNIANSLEKIF